MKEITMTYKKVELVKTDITRIFKRYAHTTLERFGKILKHETRTSSYNEEPTENK